jgi:hypothetical protein
MGRAKARPLCQTLENFMRWFLLLALIVSLYMTLETLGVIDSLKKNPMKLTELIWGNKNNSSINSMPNNLRTTIENKAVIWAVMISVSVTLFLAKATYEAFFS